ncbi:MAG: ImmA/IrrE family metallo-endopeptidase [Firmicutes bacterium]|nr:ImmA/IrrE family metallo-endopeptidase [Bacillota bacterium]
MDYKTKPVSRITLRKYASIFRMIFGVNESGQFPVLEALDKVADIFPGCSYLIVADECLPKTIPARCVPIGDGNFLIEIKESVYVGAYEKNIGAYLGFICHEICHIFLFKIGYAPIFDRSFQNNELPAYESVEWQAKALCGEVMMPYEETKSMCVEQIISEYSVSKGFAISRKKY